MELMVILITCFSCYHTMCTRSLGAPPGPNFQLFESVFFESLFSEIVFFEGVFFESVFSENFFDPKLTQPKLFQTERTR